MEQEVVRYELVDSKGLWPTIVDRFGGNISKNGVPYFKGKTPREEEFIRFCKDHSLQLRRKTVLEFDGKGSPQSQFYYFSVRDLRDYEQEFIELACDGGGKGMCWNDAKQIRKVTVTPQIAKLVQRYDIAVKNYPISPRI